MKTTDYQERALGRATSSLSVLNYPAILQGFIDKGISEADILPRENVFTFDAWRALGRYVRRGEHGVRILTWVPMTKKDPETGEVDLAACQLIDEESERRILLKARDGLSSSLRQANADAIVGQRYGEIFKKNPEVYALYQQRLSEVQQDPFYAGNPDTPVLIANEVAISTGIYPTSGRPGEKNEEKPVGADLEGGSRPDTSRRKAGEEFEADADDRKYALRMGITETEMPDYLKRLAVRKKEEPVLRSLAEAVRG